jgi:hypothetical protein
LALAAPRHFFSLNKCTNPDRVPAVVIRSASIQSILEFIALCARTDASASARPATNARARPCPARLIAGSTARPSMLFTDATAQGADRFRRVILLDFKF